MLSRRFPRPLWLVCAALLVQTGVAAAETSSCAETGHGPLSGDCVGDLYVRDGGVDLGGHTVFGRVVCLSDDCRVRSDPPDGRIVWIHREPAVGVEGAGRVSLTDVVVSGFSVGVRGADVDLAGALIVGNGGHGVWAEHTIETVDSVVADNAQNGLHAALGTVTVLHSEVVGNRGHGVRALTGVVAEDSTVADNGGDGVRNFSALASIVRSKVTGNGLHGVRTDDSDCFPVGPFSLVDSVVSGNAIAAECAVSETCSDVVACATPEMTGANACGTSSAMHSAGQRGSWSVCAADR